VQLPLCFEHGLPRAYHGIVDLLSAALGAAAALRGLAREALLLGLGARLSVAVNDENGLLRTAAGAPC